MNVNLIPERTPFMLKVKVITESHAIQINIYIFEWWLSLFLLLFSVWGFFKGGRIVVGRSKVKVTKGSDMDKMQFWGYKFRQMLTIWPHVGWINMLSVIGLFPYINSLLLVSRSYQPWSRRHVYFFLRNPYSSLVRYQHSWNRCFPCM